MCRKRQDRTRMDKTGQDRHVSAWHSLSLYLTYSLILHAFCDFDEKADGNGREDKEKRQTERQRATPAKTGSCIYRKKKRNGIASWKSIININQ